MASFNSFMYHLSVKDLLLWGSHTDFHFKSLSRYFGVVLSEKRLGVRNLTEHGFPFV